MMRRAATALIALCLTAGHAFAWGASGHSIVAEIAQRRLMPAVMAKIGELIGPQASLASLSGWADDVAFTRPNTMAWHFVNIPYDSASYVPERDCRQTPRGDCVVAAIERFRRVLSDTGAAREDRVEALKFLVHFVADAHQPMHCAERNGDQGGNLLPVAFFGTRATLHAVWDIHIIERHSHDWGEWVRELEAKELVELGGRDGGTAVEWVEACHALAVSVAYAIPESAELDSDYYAASLPVVRAQLALAGLRLAKTLNEALSGE